MWLKFAIFGCLWAVALGFPSSLWAMSQRPKPEEKKVIAYYFIKSAKDGYRPENVPAHLLTHLIYAFLDISNQGECTVIKDGRDSDADERLLKEFTQLKTLHPKLKTLLSIGGVSRSKNFSKVASSKANRKKFVTSCLAIMNKHKFDGVDIDWEIPGQKTWKNPVSYPEDPANLVKLLAEFRKQSTKDTLITAAVAPSVVQLARLKIREMARQLHWFGLMNYSLCGHWSERSCHHSGYVDHGLKATQFLMEHGVSARKIILGVPFYGLKWKVNSTQNHGIGQIINHPSHKNDQHLTFREIQARNWKAEGFEYFWDAQKRQPVWFSSDERVLISFDDAKSIQYKAQEVREKGLGGMMIWEVSGDDPEHSLLTSIRSNL